MRWCNIPITISPKDMAEKWARRLSGAIEDIRKGVDTVAEAPSKKAIAKKDKFKTNLVKAIDDGTWEKELGKYGLEEWKTDMKTKAVERIPGGVERARGDFEAFASELLAYESKLLAEVEKKPDVTLEDSIARATYWIREMAKFKRK